MWDQKGPPEMLENQVIKVSLLDGWQKAKLNRPRYPLARRDKRFVGQVHDGLQKAIVSVSWTSHVPLFCPFLFCLSSGGNFTLKKSVV